jgi:hypothetical protein
MLPKAIIAKKQSRMATVGEILVEMHRCKNARHSQRSNLEKEMVWEKDYDTEVHLKSVVRNSISEGVM